MLLFIVKGNNSQAEINSSSLINRLIPRPQEITIGSNFWKYRQGRIICSAAGEPEIFHMVKSVQNIFDIQGHFFPIAAVQA